MSKRQTHYVVYKSTVSQLTHFVCVELVNYTVDAQNNVGKPGMVCPQCLENGESLSVTCSIKPQEL